ncbi:MAG TPA: hypothetical protein VLV15_07760, partial [Dongiaceae bacterium]|nr:hypothetical protein [Dongiaceae bacterium]
MTEPEDPKPAPGDPETPPEPHGLVEELREEISHAVEHVPKPVRWTARKLVALIGLALVALVALTVVSTLLYFSNRTQLLAQELTVFLNGTLAARSDVSVEIGDIHGNPLSGVTLIRPRVRFRDGKGPPLLEAPSIRLNYSAWGLLRARGRFVDVQIQSPVVRLTRRPDGSWRLPEWRSGPARIGGNGPEFDARLRLQNGRILSPDSSDAVEGLNLEAFVASHAETRATVRRLSWTRGPAATRDVAMSGEIATGDSIRFVVQRFTSRDVTLRARGAWKKGEREKLVHLDIERVRWRWIAAATGTHTFDVPGEGR